MGDLNEAVRRHLDRVTPEKRRRDAETLLELMTRITGEAPRLWGASSASASTTTSTRAVARGCAGGQLRTAHGRHDDLSTRRHWTIRAAAQAPGTAYHRRRMRLHQRSRHD